MNTNDLRYFLAVADTAHFGHAAKRCGVATATVSTQIKKLEQSLGVTLFERTNRRVMLTEEGMEIAILARKALQEVEAIHDFAESRNDPYAGKFRLGAFPTLATYIFPQVVAQVKAAMPNLKLYLIEEKTDELLGRLREGTIDAALLALPIDDSNLVCQELFKDEFHVAVPAGHRLSSQSQIKHSQLRNERIMLLDEGHCMRDQALELCKQHGYTEEHDFKATSLETLRQMVKSGAGITIMPEIAIPEYAEQGIAYLQFRQPSEHRRVGLVWRGSSKRTLLLKRLTEVIKQ